MGNAVKYMILLTNQRKNGGLFPCSQYLSEKNSRGTGTRFQKNLIYRRNHSRI